MAGVKSIWTQPPVIKPNYGKPKSMFPKSNLTRVLLHDNVNHEHLLQVKLSRISLEKRRSSRLLELHRKSFVTQQSIKHQQLRAMGITHHSLVPDHVASAHYKVAKLVHRSSPKNHPSHHRLHHSQNAQKRRFVAGISHANSDDRELLSIPTNIITPMRKIQTIDCHLNSQNKMEVHSKETLTQFRTVQFGKTGALSRSEDDNKDSVNTDDSDDSSHRDDVDDTVFKHRLKPSRILDVRFRKLRNSLIPPYKPGDAYLKRTVEGRENVLSNRHDAGKHVRFLPGLAVVRGQTF